MSAQKIFENLEELGGSNIQSEVPNIFSIIGGNKEDRISDFYNYLLYPCKNHGIGTNFLKNFLPIIIEKGKNLSKYSDLSDRIVSSLNLKDTDVLLRQKIPQGKCPDLVLEIPRESKESLTLVIENKFGSSEGTEQLEDYRSWAEQEYSSPLLLVYLTIEGKKPENSEEEKEWIRLSHHEDILPEIKDLGKNERLDNRTKSLIKQFHNYLEGEIMKDQIDEKVKAWWENNRKVMNEIIDYGLRKKFKEKLKSKIRETKWWTSEDDWRFGKANTEYLRLWRRDKWEFADKRRFYFLVNFTDPKEGEGIAVRLKYKHLDDIEINKDKITETASDDFKKSEKSRTIITAFHETGFTPEEYSDLLDWTIEKLCQLNESCSGIINDAMKNAENK